MRHLVIALLCALNMVAVAQTQPSGLRFYDINGFYFGTLTDFQTYNPLMLPEVGMYDYANNEWYIAVNGGPFLDSAVVWNDPTPQIGMEFQQIIRLNARDSVFMDTLATHNTRLISGLSRSNHTGTQAISTVTGLQAALDGKLSVEVDGSTTNEIELPDMSGQSGKLLSNNGSAATWVNSPGAPTQNDNVSRTLNSNYTISASQRSRCSYSVNVTWSLAALLSGSGAAFLEYSTDGGSNWVTVNNVGKSIGLLTFAGADDLNLSGEVPANALVRIRTTSSNMTVTYTRGQEVLY